MIYYCFENFLLDIFHCLSLESMYAILVMKESGLSLEYYIILYPDEVIFLRKYTVCV